MARLLVGLPALRGDIQKYKQRFDLVELRPVDTSLPRVTTLRKWRKSVPPGFVFSVVLPIARPGMAVLGMLTFMTAWNDFFWPVITLNSSNPTVQVALNNLGSGYVPDTAVIMAGTLVGTLPVIVVFLLLGRQIVGGIIAGAVKG